jgi:hypothetical protein
LLFQDRPNLSSWSHVGVEGLRSRDTRFARWGLTFQFSRQDSPRSITVSQPSRLSSRYHGEIARVIAARDGDADPSAIMAFLIQEDLNPFDHHAIRVDLFYGAEVGTAGYFAHEQALIF